jgi:integrase
MGSKRDAELFEADITRRRRLRQLAQIDAGRQTVAQFAREWWRIHAEPNLSPRTRESYAVVFDKHVLPRVGGLALREVTPVVVAGLSADLQRAGVGPAAIRKALTVLQGIFPCAVTWGHVQANPVVGVRKPSAKRKRAVAPPSVALVERMRAAACDRRLRDATLLAVLAYAGLRPQEALALPWRNVRDRTLLIDRAQGNEGAKTTKTGRTRSVRLLAPLAVDLAAWRLAPGEQTIGRRRTRLPDHDWRAVARPRLAQLAPPRLRSACCQRRRARHAPLRPTPRLLLAAHRGGSVGGRGRPPSRPRTDDDTRHLRPRHGRPRRRRTALRRGRNPRRARG